MEVLYKVYRWCTRESDIAEVKATRQTDKTVWFMHGKHERKELKSTSYYRYFNTKAEAIALIESKNENARARKADELLKKSAPALLEALEYCKELLLTYEFNRIDKEEIAEEALAKIDAAIEAARGE